MRQFCVLGYPVFHSKSPKLFNYLFKHHNIDAKYDFLEEQSPEKAIQIIRSQNIEGVSITIPHKTNMMKYCDKIHQTAKQIGCINTFNLKNGMIHGYNYDGAGAVEGLISTLEKKKINWRDYQIIIIGNGGSARGIAMTMALEYQITSLILLVRSHQKAKRLADDLSNFIKVQLVCLSENYSDVFASQKSIIINTTPIGMFPQVNQSPIDHSFLNFLHIVYDIVYNPLETNLLRDAKSKGAMTINGLEMFVGQARLQFKLWTGIEESNSHLKQILS